MSISKIARFSFLLVVIFVILAIFLNFSLIRRVRTFNDKNRDIESHMVQTLSDMDKLMIVMSVQTDLYRKGLLPMGVTVEQLTQLNDLSKNLKLQLGSMMLTFEDMNKYSLNRHSRYLEEMLPILETIQQYNSNIESYTVQNTQRDNQFTYLTNEFSQLKSQFSQFQNENSKLRDIINDDISLVLNTTFVILIIIIFLFGYAIQGFMSVQLPYIQKSLLALGNHQYGARRVIPKPVFEEEKIIHNQIERVFDENLFIESLREKLLDVYLMEDAMDTLFKSLSLRMKVDRLGIAFVDYQEEKIIAEYGVHVDGTIRLGPGFEVPFKSTSLHELIMTKQTRITPDIEQALTLNPASASLRLLHQEGIQSNAILPILINQTVFGFLFLSSKQKNYFNEQHISFVTKLLLEIRGLLNRAYFSKLVFSKMTESFAQLVDKKDNSTGDHINRMVQYSVLLARALKKQPLKEGYEIDEKLILEIERQASSHDIGKIGVPDAILKKDGKLTSEEWVVMREHPVIGANVFKDLREGLKIFDPDFYRVAEDITRYHHERWDGSGYPEGLSGLAIPLVARIVAIADVFDAISSKRVYKNAYDLDTTFNIIKESKETHLDPYLVDLFLNERENIVRIYSLYGGLDE